MSAEKCLGQRCAVRPAPEAARHSEKLCAALSTGFSAPSRNAPNASAMRNAKAVSARGCRRQWVRVSRGDRKDEKPAGEPPARRRPCEEGGERGKKEGGGRKRSPRTSPGPEWAGRACPRADVRSRSRRPRKWLIQALKGWLQSETATPDALCTAAQGIRSALAKNKGLPVVSVDAKRELLALQNGGIGAASVVGSCGEAGATGRRACSGTTAVWPRSCPGGLPRPVARAAPASTRPPSPGTRT